MNSHSPREEPGGFPLGRKCGALGERAVLELRDLLSVGAHMRWVLYNHYE